MGKYIVLWLFVLFLSCGLDVEASEGNINIVINESEEFEFEYTKVADYENGEFLLAEEYKNCDVEWNELDKGVDFKHTIEQLTTLNVQGKKVKTKNQVVRIQGLSEGVYLIEGIKKPGYKIPATLVSIPNWNQENEEMSYSTTIIPKIQKEIEPVDTGDVANIFPLLTLSLLSLVVVLVISIKAYFLKDED